MTSFYRNKSCVPTNVTSNRFNGVSNPIAAAAGLPIVKVWAETATRGQDHPGTRIKQHASTPTDTELDCTHYCLMSGVPDRWAVLTMRTVARELERRLRPTDVVA